MPKGRDNRNRYEKRVDFGTSAVPVVGLFILSFYINAGAAGLN